MKHSYILIWAVAFISLLIMGDARKSLEVRNSRFVYQPNVLDKQFKFATGKHYWEVDMTPPAVQIGWKTD